MPGSPGSPFLPSIPLKPGVPLSPVDPCNPFRPRNTYKTRMSLSLWIHAEHWKQSLYEVLTVPGSPPNPSSPLNPVVPGMSICGPFSPVSKLVNTALLMSMNIEYCQISHVMNVSIILEFEFKVAPLIPLPPFSPGAPKAPGLPLSPWERNRCTFDERITKNNMPLLHGMLWKSKPTYFVVAK